MDYIRIRGARTHNLKNVSLDLPRNQLVVITGLSGSGKSSLAFDTLYAEGQRRYVESLSAYARQFLARLEKPDVDLIEGLSPAIAIEQKATSHNPRSTVGTVTEIHDYLRVLFARAGTPFCPNHPDQALDARTVSEMVDLVLAQPDESRWMILAPIIEDRKGEHQKSLANLRAQGFVRVRLNGSLVDLDQLPALDKRRRHQMDVVVDRFRVRAGMRQRIAESIETALLHGEGRVRVTALDHEEELLLSAKFACPQCGHALSEMAPRLFSFNNPAGACPGCNGLGVVTYVDPQRVVRHPERSLAEGAIAGWDKRNSFYHQMLRSLADHYGFDIDTPFEALPKAARDAVLHGSGDTPIRFSYLGDNNRRTEKSHPFEGVVRNFERRYRETESAAVREELGRYRASQTCTQCRGTRLRSEANHVRLAGHTLAELSALPLVAAREFFTNLSLSGQRAAVADPLITEIRNRLGFLVDVGLGYLTLARSADTLSGGEAQRIRLASQIGSGLTGVMYVLDEPSIGLHQRDNDRLLATLTRLRDLGNSVIVVEHDEDAIRQADFVVDIGPGAGVHGGEILFAGTPATVTGCEHSLTGDYLAGRRMIAVPERRITPRDGEWLRVLGCRGNNLKSVDLAIPLGTLCCITGVSGSGKSTLINDTLARLVAQQLHGATEPPEPFRDATGLDRIDKIVRVDQAPIGRTPRSNVATYTGLLTPIRELFAGVPEARERGYAAGRFSFNVKGGRCEACQGDGLVRVEMHFLPDIYVPCDHCQGQRYNRETLEIRYKGRTIHEVLRLTVEQAAEFFSAVPAVLHKLQTLQAVGLSYIELGQSATTMSGGEAQRVKLALELSRRDSGRTLYVLDEPTTGLHFHDIGMLVDVLQKLRDRGNTVIVVEHNLDVIKTADWIIDLGPEGGQGGGTVVAAGPPEHIAASPQSHTGSYLKRVLR